MHPEFTRQLAADHIKMLRQEAYRARRARGARGARRLLRNPIHRAG